MCDCRCLHVFINGNITLSILTERIRDVHLRYGDTDRFIPLIAVCEVKASRPVMYPLHAGSVWRVMPPPHWFEVKLHFFNL